MRQASPSGVIVRRYYRLSGAYTLSASVIWGVNTLFLLDAGLSFFEVFIANAAFSAGTVLFEIPTGVVADTVGRRTSFLASTAVLSASTLLYVGLAATGSGVVPFALASILMGLGFTFYSGAVEAWLVDALDATGFDGVLDHVFARGQQVTGAMMLFGTVGGGLLGQWDLSAPFYVRSGLLLAIFAMAYRSMHDIGFDSRQMTLRETPSVMRATARAGVEFGWRHPSLKVLMIAGAFQAGVLGWAFYAWQPYFLELLDRDAVWIAGLVSAGLALATIAGNQIVDVVSRYCGRRSTLLAWSAGLQGLAAIVMGIGGSFWVSMPALMVLAVALGLGSPVRQAFFHQVVPSKQRATVLSFDAMVGGVGGAGGQVSLGSIGDVRSVSAGFVTGGVVMLLALPFVRSLRRLSDPADHFVGSQAGIEGSCAARGLPAVAAVVSVSATTTAAEDG